MDAGRGNNDLVRRVFVKGLWQAGRLDRYTGRESNQPNAGIIKGHIEPLGDIVRKLQSPMFNQLRDFPARDDAHAKAIGAAIIEHFALRVRQARVSVHPPDPYMGIEQNHCEASQSSTATGSVGRSYVIGTPRNGNSEPGWRAAFTTTVTSTSSPAGNGNFVRCTSPCSSTVVSIRIASMSSIILFKLALLKLTDMACKYPR